MALEHNTCKGYSLFPPQHRHVLYFEQAGSQKKLTEAGYWYATAPEDELRELMQQDPSILRDWDDTYGDRMCKIVIIGQNLDRPAIEAALDACLAD